MRILLRKILFVILRKITYIRNLYKNAYITKKDIVCDPTQDYVYSKP